MYSFLRVDKCFITVLILLSPVVLSAQNKADQKKPNILFCIADDASFQHMGAYGYGFKWVKTPGFDQVANNGLLFMHAYTPNAKCAPSRAAILTGRNSWQLEAAGNHNAYFPAKFITVMETLTAKGYDVGFTGKGWGPGEPGKTDGRKRQLTGTMYSDIKTKTPTRQISGVDYAANFESFLAKRPKNKPFCFWYGSHEPHRQYEYGSGIHKGHKSITDITRVPPFWIDNETTRTDMLDYAFEVEYFDQHVQKMLNMLEKAGELENTIVIVTSDNGMPFPRIKGHMYEYDNHLPLAIMWKGHIANPGRKINDYVSFIDFAPTFLEIAGIKPSTTSMQPIQGESLIPIIKSRSGENIETKRDHVLVGREREDVGRPHDEGYPERGIVKGKYFFAVNYEPDRWPSGNPETGYMDTDGSPTKTELLAANRKGQYVDLWKLCFGKKPAEELYDIVADPYCLNNLAYNPAFAKVKVTLRKQMEGELKQQQDPRMFGNGHIFDDYPYAQDRVRNFYERFFKGEKMATGWIESTDFEKPGFKPAN